MVGLTAPPVIQAQAGGAMAGPESEESGDEDDMPGDLPVIDDDAPRTRRQTVQRKITNRTQQHGDEHLPHHRQSREMTAEIRSLVVEGIKKDRFCNILNEEHIQRMVDKMEFYTFAAGEDIVEQGQPGRYFFVLQDGVVSISKGGTHVCDLGPANGFGSIALVLNCPRTATASAKEACGLWGADGSAFRNILQQHGRVHYQENLRLLGYVSWFDGLSALQKEYILEHCLLTQSFEDGNEVIRQGDVPSAIYVIKKGKVAVIIDGKTLSHLGAGDTFGERSVLYGTVSSATVKTEGPCEFISIGVSQLKSTLGENLTHSLESALVHSVIRHIAALSAFSVAQQVAIVKVMQFKKLKANERLPSGAHLVIVIDGSLHGHVQGAETKLTRGQSCQEETLLELEKDLGKPLEEIVCTPRLNTFKAGPDGCRLATLTKDQFREALDDECSCGPSGVERKTSTVDLLKKKLMAREVPILRDLSEDKVDMLLSKLVLNTYSLSTQVISQGQAGSTFYIVKSGEVRVIRDGHVVRVLGSNTCFGERALLLKEVRSATVEVSSSQAELWEIDEGTFQQIIQDQMREQLIQRLKLNDTTVKMRSLEHVKVIGAGSFGSVRMVQHRWSKLRYALKRVRKDPSSIECVKRECNLLMRVDHPFILGIIRIFETKSSIYILTELLTGGQLYDQLGKMGVLTRKQAQFYGGILVIALGSLHQKHIMYRDLKPENVMLDAQGYLKLIDFGLAKFMDKKIAKTYTAAGTPAYMAPEIVKGTGHGYEVDVWSLGVMMYEFVIGELPFGTDANDVTEIIMSVLEDKLHIPPKYNDAAGKRLITGMLNKDPWLRIGTGDSTLDTIRSHKYWKQGMVGQGDLFNKLLSRELTPPSVPPAERYSEFSDDEEAILSDAQELYCGD